MIDHQTEKSDPKFSWSPHPGPQWEYCSRGEFEVLFGGAKGPGKTDCLIMDCAEGVAHPRFHGLLLRRTFPRLQEVIDRCYQYYPHYGGDYRTTEHRWYFPSGAKITLGHVQNEADKYNYHGKEFHFIGFDELTEFTHSMYTFILANVRMAVAGLTLRVRCTTNPGNIGHVWVKKHFVDPCKPTEFIDYKSGDGTIRQMGVPKVYIDPDTHQSRCFVPATVFDNPSLMIHDPGYAKRLEGLPTVEKQRLLYGIWDIFEGQVFTELSQRVHGCDWFSIPPEWELFSAFDWGYSRPWCYLVFALDFDGVLYLFLEYYGMKGDDPNQGVRQTNTEIINKIKEIEHTLPTKVRTRVADPACWGPTKMKGSNTVLGPSFYEDASRQGLFFLKADNDRLRGKQQIHERFKLETETDPETGEVTKEYSNFLVFKSCTRWWEEIQSLQEDPRNDEDVDTDQADEGYDCTRYAMLFRPVKPKRTVTVPPGSFAAERNKYIKAKQYAIRHGVSMSVAYGRVR